MTGKQEVLATLRGITGAATLTNSTWILPEYRALITDPWTGEQLPPFVGQVFAHAICGFLPQYKVTSVARWLRQIKAEISE